MFYIIFYLKLISIYLFGCDLSQKVFIILLMPIDETYFKKKQPKGNKLDSKYSYRYLIISGKTNMKNDLFVVQFKQKLKRRIIKML